jgi:broad specificity phosphatase PhoE
MGTTLILVRHGRTAWNKEERFRGRTDLPLDEVGLQQAEAVGRRVAAQYRPKAVYSSPLERARRTAEAIARHVRLAVQPHQGLLDLDYGAFSGLSLAEAEERFPELYRAWQAAPHTVRFPQGESLEDVRARALALVHELAGQYPGEQVVLVSHVVICRVLFCALLDVGLDHFWRFRPDPASLSVFELGPGGAILHLANDTCHLAEIR